MLRAALFLLALAGAWASDVQPLDPHMPQIEKKINAPDVLDGDQDPAMTDGGFHKPRRGPSGEETMKMKALDKEEENAVDGEVTAMAVLGGQKLIPGVDMNNADAVRYRPLMAQHAAEKSAAKLKQKLLQEQKDMGESAPVKRTASLLLARETFSMEAASRDDGVGVSVDNLEQQSLLQVAAGGDFGEDEDFQGDYPGDPAAPDAKAAAHNMVLDPSESSLVADEVTDDLKSRHPQRIGEDVALPSRFPLMGKPAIGKLCKNKAYTYICAHWKKEGKCKVRATAQMCSKTCELCGQGATVDEDEMAQGSIPKAMSPDDCQVGPWTWSSCTDGSAGTKTGSRKVTREKRNDGVDCPKLTVTVKCNKGLCHANCKTCNGSAANNCLSCYGDRDSALSAPKETAYAPKMITGAWQGGKRMNILMGEAGWHLKVMDAQKLTGICVWEKDIKAKEFKSEDGDTSCEMGCDPPALMGNHTPGFVCRKKCIKKEWGFDGVLPVLSKATLVYSGKASRATCHANKAISCAPKKKLVAGHAYSADDAIKCEARKTGRCAGLRAGTYKMHRTSAVLGDAQALFLSREYTAEVAMSCKYEAKLSVFKECMANPAGETSSVRSNALSNKDDTSFVNSMMERSYEEGWLPMQLDKNVWHYVKFSLDPEDSATYQCPHNDFCQQFAVQN